MDYGCFIHFTSDLCTHSKPSRLPRLCLIHVHNKKVRSFHIIIIAGTDVQAENIVQGAPMAYWRSVARNAFVKKGHQNIFRAVHIFFQCKRYRYITFHFTWHVNISIRVIQQWTWNLLYRIFHLMFSLPRETVLMYWTNVCIKNSNPWSHSFHCVTRTVQVEIPTGFYFPPHTKCITWNS